MTKKKGYGNDSITALKGADRVRKKPSVIFGSDGLEGCEHAVFEILSNAIDEARAGYGSLITITRYLDGSIQVDDQGRGCPVDWNETEQRYNWELVFCELYAGGKYGRDGDYKYALGLNGLGSCATQYASEFMDVVVIRDGKRYNLHFEKGENVGGLHEEAAPKSAHTGTSIRWKPDREVFMDTDIPAEYFADTVKRQAVVNAGITFLFRNETEPGRFEEVRFLYEHGLTDYVTELAGEGTLTVPVFFQSPERSGRDRADMDDYKVKLSVAFCFSSRVQVIEHYHNSSWLEYGGSPDRAVRSGFVSALDAYLKSQGKYNKGESKIAFQDIQDSLVLVTNDFSTETSYENQTKKAINNKFVQEAMTDFLKEQLEIYFIENPLDAQKIAEQVLINKRARENAEKTRLNIKKKLTGSMDISNRVQKFVDCRTRDASRRELYIVEGDSALGSVKLARDSEFQAIMPVRGKILNCLKSDYAKIFKSEVITDLLRVLGCGVEVKDRHAKEMAGFDLSALRWNKVIICTDADVDGFQIRTLILTMLYRLTPTLIQEGYVYIAESPLFEIICKGDTWFAYSNAEKDSVVAKLKGKNCDIQRSKGLGENDPDMMWLTTMNPDTRRLIKVMPEDVEQTATMFDLLLGDDLQGRKNYIASDGHLFLDLADIS